MKYNEKVLNELSEIKKGVVKGGADHKNLEKRISLIKEEIENRLPVSRKIKSNLIKSFLIKFNESCFSDFTIIFLERSSSIEIIETAGIAKIKDEFCSRLHSNHELYRAVEIIEIDGISFRIFHESMENNNGVYTVLTLTESDFFKPSRFHIFCDIMMELIRTTDISTTSLFNDYFEDTIVNINKSISLKNIKKPEFYLFRFDNIINFFVNSGIDVIFELSDMIMNKLGEVFKEESSIFRFSLSDYIVLLSTNDDIVDNENSLNRKMIIDFVFKGIILQYRFIKIPYNESQSIYDIFEKIFHISKK